MRFCLDQKKLGGYNYGDKTYYSDKHLGIDWYAKYVPLFAPEDGTIVKAVTGTQGGKTIWFKPKGKTILIRFLHLSDFLVREGAFVTEGQKIAITGNSGASTTPHLHEDHWPKGVVTLKFADTQNPNIYYSTQLNKTFMKATIIANKIAWDYKAQIPVLASWFKNYSNNKLEIVFDSKDTNFNSVPLAPFIDGFKSVDINWYRENITPLATGHATVLLLNPTEYQNGSTWGFMTYGDAGKPVRCEVASEDNPSFPEAHIFVHRAFHELCHALYFLTGQPDRTHELLLVPENQLPTNRAILLNEIDYQKLQQKLLTINPQGEPMLIYKFDDNGTQYVLADDGTLIGIANASALAKTLKGRPQKLVVLPASQRGNFTIADSAIN